MSDAVDCPYCGATAGYSCHRPTESIAIARPISPHASRRAAVRDRDQRPMTADPGTMSASRAAGQTEADQ